jgi:hypothetical protein
MVGQHPEDEPISNAAQAALSDKLDHFSEALCMLYIKDNLSGRNKFREKWPEAAQFIFSDALIAYDNEGVTDREHRSVLENDAEERRAALLEKITEIPEKSVDSGALEFDYVGEVLDTYGPKISLLLYKDDIIQRVRPDFIKKVSAKEQGEPTPKTEPDKTAKNAVSEDIKPIETPVPEGVHKTPLPEPPVPTEDQSPKKPEKGHLVELFNPLAIAA